MLNGKNTLHTYSTEETFPTREVPKEKGIKYAEL